MKFLADACDSGAGWAGTVMGTASGVDEATGTEGEEVDEEDGLVPLSEEEAVAVARVVSRVCLGVLRVRGGGGKVPPMMSSNGR